MAATLMKLIVAIVQDYDTDGMLRAVSAAGFGATRIASTGGFLRMGNTTILMGVPVEDVTRCLNVIGDCCRHRVHQHDPVTAHDMGWLMEGTVVDVPVGGAVVFILPVERFLRI